MFDNLDDPKQQALLAAAFGLLGGSGGKGFRGFAQDAGKAGLLGLNRYAVANEDKRRNTESAARQKMTDFQFQQMQRGAEDQDFARQLAPNFFSQGVQPSTPNDDQGNPMPSSAPKADFMGYGQALAARNPQMGAQFMAMAPKPQQPQYKEVGGRLVRIDGNDRVSEAYAPPDKPVNQPGQTRELKSGRRIITQEFDGKGWKTISTSDMDKPDGPDKGPAAPQGYRWTQSGGLEPIPGGPADTKGGKASEAELTAAGFASRMTAANDLISKMPEDSTPGIRQTIANNKYPMLAPFVSSEGQQQYRQAQEDWVRAKLRKESGAVIADEEMAREIRVYFPQPGDEPKTIKQKAEARERANQAMMLSAGKARSEIGATGNSVDDLVKKYLKR